MEKQPDRCVRQTQSGKRKYKTPRVIRYGDVATVTQGSGKGAFDVHGASKHSCWIAEVIYGVDAPRTQLIRVWLTECYERREPWSLVVVPLYSRFGERIAAFLRCYPAFQGLFRPLFDLGVRRAHQHRTAALLGIAAAASTSA